MYNGWGGTGAISETLEASIVSHEGWLFTQMQQTGVSFQDLINFALSSRPTRQTNETFALCVLRPPDHLSVP